MPLTDHRSDPPHSGWATRSRIPPNPFPTALRSPTPVGFLPAPRGRGLSKRWQKRRCAGDSWGPWCWLSPHSRRCRSTTRAGSPRKGVGTRRSPDPRSLADRVGAEKSSVRYPWFGPLLGSGACWQGSRLARRVALGSACHGPVARGCAEKTTSLSCWLAEERVSVRCVRRRVALKAPASGCGSGCGAVLVDEPGAGGAPLDVGPEGRLDHLAAAVSLVVGSTLVEGAVGAVAVVVLDVVDQEAAELAFVPDDGAVQERVGFRSR